MAATKNPEKNPNLTEQPPAVQSQAQSTSAEPEHKRKNAPEKSDETVFFDTTIAKVKKIKNEETGRDEYVTVMSDHLDPGEELKTARDERLAKEKNAKRGKDTDKESNADKLADKDADKK